VVVSVVKLTAVVLLSVTTTGLVVVSTDVVLLLLFCRFRKYSWTARSLMATSTSRVASSGSSRCTASMPRGGSSNTPSRYCGERWMCNAASSDSFGRSCINCLISRASELSPSYSVGVASSTCARTEARGRANRRSERMDGILAVRGRCFQAAKVLRMQNGR
jgi:hypothetical protein